MQPNKIMGLPKQTAEYLSQVVLQQLFKCFEYSITAGEMSIATRKTADCLLETSFLTHLHATTQIAFGAEVNLL